MSKLHIESFALGDWMTNCYVLHLQDAAKDAPCWIVDVGYEPGPMIDYIKAHGLAPRQVVLTHAHPDHIGGLDDIRGQWPDLPILIHPAEKDWLTDPGLNLSVFLAEPLVAPEATGTIEPGDELTFEGFSFDIRHTPGHSPGGISLYQAESKVVLVGDALFAQSIGRTDFPSSDGSLLIRSIGEQLLTLPDETQVLPGHGSSTSIGAERRDNPFLQVS